MKSPNYFIQYNDLVIPEMQQLVVGYLGDPMTWFGLKKCPNRQHLSEFVARLTELSNQSERNRTNYTLLLFLSDSYFLLNDFKQALFWLPQPHPKNRRTYGASWRCELLHLLDKDIDGYEMLSMFPRRLTKYGMDRIIEVMEYLDIQLGGFRDNVKTTILEWAILKDGLTKRTPHVLYNGTPYSRDSFSRDIHGFETSSALAQLAADSMRSAENALREDAELPRVGEGWISETRLYYAVKTAFTDLEVIQHARPAWLKRQHLDIFIPALSVAVEYQGPQHNHPVEFFGGLSAYEAAVRRDRRKKALCTRNGVKLIQVSPDYSVEELVETIQSIAADF